LLTDTGFVESLTIEDWMELENTELKNLSLCGWDSELRIQENGKMLTG